MQNICNAGLRLTSTSVTPIVGDVIGISKSHSIMRGTEAIGFFEGNHNPATATLAKLSDCMGTFFSGCCPTLDNATDSAYLTDDLFVNKRS